MITSTPPIHLERLLPLSSRCICWKYRVLLHTDTLIRPSGSHVSPGESFFLCDVQPSQYHTAWAPFMDPYSMGFPFQVSRLPHPTQTSVFDIYIIARTDISLCHRQLTNSFSLQTQVRMCWIWQGSKATQTTFWPARIGSALRTFGMRSWYVLFDFCLPSLCCIA